MSLALLATPKRRTVPFSLFFVAVFALGALAVALADPTVGTWYIGSLGIAVMVGGGIRGLKLNMPKQTELLILGTVGSLAACVFGATFITQIAPVGAIEYYNLVLPLSTVQAVEVWSFGVQLIGWLLSGVMLLAYLMYIAFNEEVVFRGSVLSVVDGVLAHKYRLLGRIAAIVGMACAFAGFHFLVKGAVFAWGPFLILSWLGTVWGVTSLATGSIWPCVFSHMIWNALAFVQRGILLAMILGVAV